MKLRTILLLAGAYVWWRTERNRTQPTISYWPAAKMPLRDDGMPMRGFYNPWHGVVINADFRHDPRILKHEMAHWQQHKRLGTLGFILQYISEKRNHGYYTMPLEVEARFAEGEFCANNPGWCERQPTPYTLN